MGPAVKALRRFARSTRGVAAVEFAVILPVLLLLFLATFDAGRAIAISTKVHSATYTLGAITNQYTTIHDTDMQQILGAASVVISPFPSAPLSVVVSEVTIDSSGKATVTWSDSLNGTARAVGSSANVPSGLNNPSTTLVLGEISYSYSPMFGYFITGPITLSDSLYVLPRSSTSIARSSP